MTIDEYLLMNSRKMSNITDNDTVDTLAYLASSERNILKPREKDACANAIRTIRKYQKIEKIIDDWNNQEINNIICCLDIKEVVEDDKV